MTDPYGSEGFLIYRKAKDSTEWGQPLATLEGTATSFPDPNVTIGTPYEYQVVKNSPLGFKGYGYICAAIRAPLVDDRGTLILVVEANAARDLSTEIAWLRQDLVGDGWRVTQINFSSDASPQQVRAAILAEYQAAPSRVNTVFLLGHVPVFLSGNLDYDTHGGRPLPATVITAMYATIGWTPAPVSSRGRNPPCGACRLFQHAWIRGDTAMAFRTRTQYAKRSSVAACSNYGWQACPDGKFAR